MMKKLFALILLLACVCVSAGAESDAPTVRLYESPSTGYTWEITFSKDSVIEIDEGTYIAVNRGSSLPVPGSGGIHTWTLKGLSEGTVTVTFTLKQVGSGNVAEVREYTYQVDADLNVSLVSSSAPTARVTLEENPTTGYTWTYVMSSDDVVSLLDEHFDENAHDEGMVGVGGVHTFVFEAVQAGDVTITFTHSRAWEQDAEAETAVYTYHVTEEQNGFSITQE